MNFITGQIEWGRFTKDIRIYSEDAATTILKKENLQANVTSTE